MPFHPLQISSILRPIHITLTPTHQTLSSLVHTLDDQYYSDKNLSHPKAHDVTAPFFDVREYAKTFILEGEFPGIGDPKDIVIDKLGPRTLLVEANTVRFALDDEWRDFQGEHGLWKEGEERTEAHEMKDGKETEEPYQVRLSERHVGCLQRSFTFPTAVDLDGARAKLRNGLLIIRVPKSQDIAKHDSSRIAVEYS
ncbi:HSP20-like chaperone [Glarea lozoyensis ATCC 20868]|uniref:HSP20-like chaperone n=1 Tax=Glarea lozoyensis (strain ATCC 20868 / MF5171) TaxID=1116229 RepID=S3E3V5_GLAL2|nr:HSP20-like chaperone [Glarea lozoyensis ATCC 20868]EPE33133.1 HSP20-like chaperone [Glarea lozoyensis ATCC 20868]